jgi:hypothetical protein
MQGWGRGIVSKYYREFLQEAFPELEFDEQWVQGHNGSTGNNVVLNHLSPLNAYIRSDTFCVDVSTTGHRSML